MLPGGAMGVREAMGEGEDGGLWPPWQQALQLSDQEVL